LDAAWALTNDLCACELARPDPGVTAACPFLDDQATSGTGAAGRAKYGRGGRMEQQHPGAALRCPGRSGWCPSLEPGDAGMAVCPLSLMIWGVLPPVSSGAPDR
jgi:hypothetical protein